jgi:hypothetical protein
MVRMEALVVGWWLQGIKLREAADPAADVLIASVFAPVTTTGQAQETVRARMHNHFVNRTSVEGVRIVDENGVIIARWTHLDEQRARQRPMEVGNA